MVIKPNLSPTYPGVGRGSGFTLTGALKGPSQPPLFSMISKLLIKRGEANSYCFTVSCVPEGVFNYLE